MEDSKKSYEEDIINEFIGFLSRKYILFASVSTNDDVFIYSSDEQVDLLVKDFLEKDPDKKKEIIRKFEELKGKWIISDGQNLKK